MESDDELVENIARRAFEARTGAAKACGMRVFSWDERTLSMKDAERAAARAALQVVKDAGWKRPENPYTTPTRIQQEMQEILEQQSQRRPL